LDSRKDRTDNIFITRKKTPTVDLPQDGIQFLEQRLRWSWQMRPHQWLELFNYLYLCPLPLVLCLLEVIAHVCPQKMAKDELSTNLPLLMACPELCSKISFLHP
jgi:hypothetical protein